MTATITEYAVIKRTLDAEGSGRVLRRACEEHAHVRLWAAVTGPEVACTGTAAACDGSQLTLEVGRIKPGVAAALPEALLQAEMGLGDARYAFETRCAGPMLQAVEGVLHVVQPTTMTAIERRRHRRRQFQKPTEVTLRATTGAERWNGRAALLNLSADGIACRVREEDIVHTPIGTILRLVFRLGHDFKEFDLTGRVINVTQAGSPHHAVIGMAFVDDSSLASAEEALRAALEDAG
jgi:hypothetical protein